VTVKYSFVVLAALLPIESLLAASPLDTVRPFLKQHCYECHGAKKQENDKRFDSLSVDLSTVETLAAWQGILDQLNRGEMPPDDSPQPGAEETAKVIELLTAQLKEAYARHRSTGGNTVARRLNRFELRNTVRELLYLNDPDLRIGNVSRLVDNNGNGSVENTSTDPFRSFPADEEEDGFDNIGDRLVMSDFLLSLMFDAAEESLDLATETGPRPNVETRRFAGHIQKQVRGDLEKLSRELNPDFDAYYRRETIMADAVRGGVGTSARYRITVEVSGHNQQHPWSELITADQDQPLQLFLRLYKSRTCNDHIPLRMLELSGDGQKRTFSVETWIDKQWLPQLMWENGPTDREARSDLLVQKFLPDQFRKAPDRKEIPDKKQYDQARADWSREMTMTAFNNYKGPQIRVHSLVLEPLIHEWPPKSHAALYGRSRTRQSLANVDTENQSLATSATDDSIENLMLRFAERAYRHSVSPAELAPFVELVRSRLLPDLDPLPSVIQGLTYKSYKGMWSKLPNFPELKPERQGEVSDGLLDIRLAKHDEHFGLVFEGTLNVTKAADYEFQMASDDGARLTVDNRKVIEHDGLHGASLKKGKAQLTKGEHTIRVEYFAYGKPNSLRASWSGPGFREAPLAAANATTQKPVDVDAQTAQTIKAMQVGYTAILCSPDFLYLREKAGQLNDYEIASRLSYFLWSSMPDDLLMNLARAGKLTDTTVLQQQVDRMLDDRKARAFTRHFTERWLRLDKITESPPELTGPFRVYWDRRMEPQIIAQTDMYFADLLQNNGPIRLLIDSDYTFMNESIASVFYGRSDVKGESMRKVATNDRRRGGIFTQPSVMTSTANGVDTSPVVRGVWVLENVFGTPPSPPPPDVEPLSPDLREAKTIREQLAMHRKQKACNSCHRKIDPLGFAFENFDPIGRWRDRYPKAREDIDASTTTSSGRKVADIVEFKKLLLDEEQLVVRCLTQKLLSYATGRVLELTDRGEVDEIVSKLESQDNRIRDLIKLVVQSRMFKTK